MKIFLKNGHISKEGFAVLIDGKINQINQYEEFKEFKLANHMSFCDECLEKYLKEIDNMPPLEMEFSQADAIFKKAKFRGWSIFSNEHTTAAVAACLALVFWTTGAFQWQNGLIEKIHIERNSYKIERIIEKTNSFTTELLDECNEILDNITGLGGGFSGKK